MPVSKIRRALPTWSGTAIVLLLLVGASLAEETHEAAELRVALLYPGDPERGAVAYSPCAACHLPDASGRDDGSFPQLAGQHATVIIKQLVDIRSGLRSNPLMLPYARLLTGPEEIADLAAYISALPAPEHNGRGPGLDLETGMTIYQRDCARCHGTHGEGHARRFVPAVAGQHYAYMLRQIRAIAGGRRGNAHPEMVALVARYSDAELQALVDYASRLEHDH
jgi:cytochrome c553